MAPSGSLIAVGKRILIVDFGGHDLRALEQALGAEGMELVRAGPNEINDQWAAITPDAVLLAVDANQERHLSALSQIKHQTDQVPVLFFGRNAEKTSVRTPSDAIAQGGDYYFGLPCDMRYLAGRVKGWAERGIRAPQVVERAQEEVPMLEGFSVGRPQEDHHPILQRLRGNEDGRSAEAPDPWHWADENEFGSDDSDFASVEIDLSEEGEEDIEAPIEVADEPLLDSESALEPTSAESPNEASEGVSPEMTEPAALTPKTASTPKSGSGVGSIEQLALLQDVVTYTNAKVASLPNAPRLEPGWPMISSHALDQLQVEGATTHISKSEDAPATDFASFGLEVGADAESRVPDRSSLRSIAEHTEVLPELMAPTQIDAKKGPIQKEAVETKVASNQTLSASEVARLRKLLAIQSGPVEIEPEQSSESDHSLSEGSVASEESVLKAAEPEISTPAPLVGESRVDVEGPTQIFERKHSETTAAQAAQDALEPLPGLTRRLRRTRRRQRQIELEESQEPVSEPTVEPTVAETKPHVAEEPNGIAPMPEAENKIESEPATQIFIRSSLARPNEGLDEDFSTQEQLAIHISSQSDPIGPMGHPEPVPDQEDELTQGRKRDFATNSPSSVDIIIEQAEMQRAQGNLAEACAGFALAAKIYLDYGRTDAARELYELLLELDPSSSYGSRLSQLNQVESLAADVEDLFLDEGEDEAIRAHRPLQAGAPREAQSQEPHPQSQEAHPQSQEPHPQSQEPHPQMGPDLGMITPRDLEPNRGVIQSPIDGIRVLLRAFAQRATGLLRIPGSSALFLAHGVPAGLVGDDVIGAFVRIVADIGRISEGQASDLSRIDFRSPRDVANQLHREGFLGAEEVNLLPLRQLENRLVRFLQHRGDWTFEASTEGLTTEDLSPYIGSFRSWLIELLSRAGFENGQQHLDLRSNTVRLVSGTEHFLSAVDAPLVQLLDGQRGLEESARLSGVSVQRALCWATVWLEEGLAERVEIPTESTTETTTSHRYRPALSELPTLTQRKNPIPSKVRLERRATPVLSLPEQEDLQREGLAEMDDENRVRALAEIVRTRDYFGILDVEPDANRKTIDDAHQKVRNLIPMDVSSDLESMVREVMRSVDEARDVLMIPELRAAYEQHLEPPPEQIIRG